MRFVEITSEPVSVEKSVALLTEAFPPEERRDLDVWRRLSAGNSIFHHLQILDVEDDGEQMVGLLTYWDFGRFVYAEHFATLPEARGKGIGASALAMLTDLSGKAILLEVELPEDDLTRRRVEFYRRNGFKLLDTPYIQPPYARGGEELPLRLMLKGELPSETSIDDVIATVHREVYRRPLEEEEARRETSKRIVIDKAFRTKAPGYTMVYMEADVTNTPDSEELKEELQQVQQRLMASLTLQEINKFPPIAATRAAYKACGKDPNRYRPSQEQMMRRIVKGQGLYEVDSLVDSGNLVSLTLGSSLGVFDRDLIEGDTLTLGIGAHGEPYEGIGRGELNIEGLPVIRDARGGIGTPTSDNERTKVSLDTRRISVCLNIYDPGFIPPEKAARILADVFIRHCGATGIRIEII